MILTPKQRRWYYLVVIIFLSVSMGAVITKVYQWSESRYKELASRTIQSNNIMSQRLNKLGQQVTTSNSNYITKDELKHGTDSTVHELKRGLVGPIRSLERKTEILTRRVEELSLQVRDTVVEYRGKQVGALTFTHSSEWMPHLRGTLIGDSIHLDYELRGGFDLEYHWAKTGIFKPKELSLMITSKDPAVKVDNVQTFHVVAPVPLVRRPGSTAAMGFVGGLLVRTLIESFVPQKQ